VVLASGIAGPSAVHRPIPTRWRSALHPAVDLSGAALAHAELVIARWFDSAMERGRGATDADGECCP
jgi:hypothetical protein